MLIAAAHEHLTAIRTADLHGQAIIFYDSHDPVEAMQMGIVSGSCTNLRTSRRGFNASVTNAIDANKKVIYQMNEKGSQVGRTLAVLSDSGIVTYEPYNTTSIDLGAAWVDYFSTYAQQVGTSLIVPVTFTKNPSLREALETSGAHHGSVNATIHNTSHDQWYDDIGRSIVHQQDLRYKNLEAYVLSP